MEFFTDDIFSRYSTRPLPYLFRSLLAYKPERKREREGERERDPADLLKTKNELLIVAERGAPYGKGDIHLLDH